LSGGALHAILFLPFNVASINEEGGMNTFIEEVFSQL
jgi:hypothetical protein